MLDRVGGGGGVSSPTRLTPWSGVGPERTNGTNMVTFTYFTCAKAELCSAGRIFPFQTSQAGISFRAAVAEARNCYKNKN